jgi:hypothetical protein
MFSPIATTGSPGACATDSLAAFFVFKHGPNNKNTLPCSGAQQLRRFRAPSCAVSASCVPAGKEIGAARNVGMRENTPEGARLRGRMASNTPCHLKRNPSEFPSLTSSIFIPCSLRKWRRSSKPIWKKPAEGGCTLCALFTDAESACSAGWCAPSWPARRSWFPTPTLRRRQAAGARRLLNCGNQSPVSSSGRSIEDMAWEAWDGNRHNLPEFRRIVQEL